MENVITVEQVEQLVETLEAEDAETRAKLERLIRAYARIVAVREPEQFKAQPLEYSDEEQEYKDYSGPALIMVRKEDTSDLATSSGFYYQWRRVTEDAGLYVSRKGVLYGCVQSGTGDDCHVSVECEYSPLSRDEISIAKLRAAEEHMRKLAFPAQAAA